MSNLSLGFTMMEAFKTLFTNNRSSNLLERNKTCITRLKFIGSIPPGYKVDSRALRLESNNLFTPIKRYFYGESREDILVFISNCVYTSFEIIQSYINSDKTSDKIFCANIIQDLIKSVSGLRNLQKTYREDKMFYCEIETLVEAIQAKVYEIQEKKPELLSIKELTIIEVNKEKKENTEETTNPYMGSLKEPDETDD